ncbi:carbonic anhydrase [Cladochytrium replicatum]|nr:carbonic anhydrase [Cladochytrium replicatum]
MTEDDQHNHHHGGTTPPRVPSSVTQSSPQSPPDSPPSLITGRAKSITTIAPSKIRLAPVGQCAPSEGASLQHLLDSNKEWSENILNSAPEFFDAMAAGQAPQYLWLGCSDSRVPPTEIISTLGPGDVFVHRNIANVISHSDMSMLSVLQYAVDYLKVKHIIVCGHYRCGGVFAAMSNKQHGLLDNWLRHVKDVYAANQGQLEAVADSGRTDLLCELNVERSVANVCSTTIVQNAWARGQELHVHGWCFRLADGLLRDLRVTVSGRKEVTMNGTGLLADVFVYDKEGVAPGH